MRLTATSRRHPNGFTLAEAMAAVVVMGVACSAMAVMLGQLIQASSAGMETSRANSLAQDLMTEIRTVRWADATYPTHWGPESGEANRQNTRAAFNDLDDYDGWSGPPQTRNGQTYDSLQTQFCPNLSSHDYAQYTCSVKVESVSASGQVLSAGQTSPYRRVTVTVTHTGQPPHRLSQTFEDPAPLLGSTHWYPYPSEPLATPQLVP